MCDPNGYYSGFEPWPKTDPEWQLCESCEGRFHVSELNMDGLCVDCKYEKENESK